MMMKFNKPLLAMALATLAFNASAHRPWLLPSSTVVEAKEPWVTVDAAISENLFETDHQPLKLDTLEISGPDGARVAPEHVSVGTLRSTFDVKLARPGTYKAGIVTQSVLASYQLGGEPKRWRGTEEALAGAIPAGATQLKVTRIHARLETFFSAGTPSDRGFKAAGVGLELVPVTHPNDLRAGEKATWRFLLDGKVLPNQAFSLIPGGVRYRGTLGEIRLVTDASGELTFDLPAPGMYLLSSSWPDLPQPPRRATYAATLEVLPQ